ncbi:hypothetical protein [Pontixanthobacter sp.]|uniref:hypothetical protein n=1 Tax=Pontixanthobacter sp. TaxID=2792078 RepID=UPI003C7DDE67
MKKVLWPILPKPWGTADMEFHYGLWNGVSSLFSQSGRQLGEENARPFILNHHIPAQMIVCKYKDSREGRKINMSALRIAMQNFDAALDITGAVHAHHLAQLPPAHVPGIWDLHIIARSSIALIAYQKRCTRHKPFQSTVSDALTSQYQFISGVFMICRHMLEHNHPAIEQNSPISAEALYNYADRHDIFISFNGAACAGSIKKIHEFLDFCNAGNALSAPAAHTLSRLVDDPDNWYQYGLATVELDCFVENERSQRLAARRGIGQSDPDRSAQTYAALGGYVRGLMDRPVPAASGSFRHGALIRQNHILEQLGRPVVKSIPRSHIRARLGCGQDGR